MQKRPRCACNALHFLNNREEIVINALDYNWSNAERARGRWAVLLEKLTESEGVYDFMYSKSLILLIPRVHVGFRKFQGMLFMKFMSWL